MKTISGSRRVYFAFLLLLASFCATGATDQEARIEKSSEKGIRVFFIGNSYTSVNELPQLLTRLGASANPPFKIETGQYTPGGFTFQRHWNKRNRVAKKMRRKPGTDPSQAPPHWDFIVLQEQSQRPILDREAMYEYAGKLVTEIDEIDDARFVFYMTWPRQNDPGRIESLAEAYEGIAEELDAAVAPVGRAWEHAIRKRPDLNLYRKDGSHPNPLGTYLAACVFYAALTGESPLGLSNGGLDIISNENAAFLQGIAWETVNDYGLGLSRQKTRRGRTPLLDPE